jgi:hypothetical protein
MTLPIWHVNASGSEQSARVAARRTNTPPMRGAVPAPYEITSGQTARNFPTCR